jgi:hypothetical protein
MADYRSIIAKAVSALDLNTEKARRRLYERARTAFRSKMYSAYPPFHRSEIAAEEMALEMAIEAVEAEAVREQSARWAASSRLTPSPPANQNGETSQSFTTLWASVLRRADEQGRREGLSDHGQDRINSGRRNRASGWGRRII